MALQTQPKLLHLPPEVLLHTLALTSPADCARVATVNRVLNVLCSTWTLYRDLLLSLSDLPTSNPAPDYPYELLCRRIVEATSALEKMQRGHPPPSDLVPLLETLVHLATSRPDANVPSLNESLLEKYFSPSSSQILALHPHFSSRQPRSRSHKTPDIALSELVSRLHVLSTPSLDAVSSHNVRTAAREIVYERLNFTRSSCYGPLKSDGSRQIDYRKVEALSVVMMANLDEAKSMGWGQEDVEDDTNIPSGWSSTRTGSAKGDDVDSRDWAGITSHEWRGTYSFLHYPVYHHYNSHRTSSYIPSLAEESEAVGDCMSLKLELLPEGVEVSPPMEAFRRTGTILRPNEARGGTGDEIDSDDESDDPNFDENAALDEEDTSDSSDDDEDEDAGNTHYVTNRAGRSQPQQAETPPTSPPDEAEAVVPPGPASGILSAPSKSTANPFPNPPATTASFPKLSFHGSSMPLQLRPLAFTGTFLNTQSHFNIRDRSIRGTVEMNEAGEVIWNYIIRYGGQDHWAMTGVQVGGPKSKYGVLGTWTCADRDAADDEGPNGPFWYWPNIPEI